MFAATRTNGMLSEPREGSEMSGTKRIVKFERDEQVLGSGIADGKPSQKVNYAEVS